MHYINKKLSIFLILCSICLFSFIEIDRVYAVSGDIAGGSLVTGNSDFFNCPGCSSASLNLQQIAFGYRVSVVDSSGNLYPSSHSYEYWSEKGNSDSEGENTTTNGYNWITQEYNPQKSQLKAELKGFQFYSEKRPKTLGKSSIVYKKLYYTENTTTDDPLNLSATKYDAYSIENNQIKIEKDYCSYPNLIGSTPGGLTDQCRGHNFTRFAQIKMNSLIDKIQAEKATQDDINVFVTYLKNCGITIDASSLYKVKDYYMLVEPLAAILSYNDSTTYIGTVNDLWAMNFYNDHMSQYVYNYWSYANPVVYTNKDMGPIIGCTADQARNYADRDKVLGEKKGCTGVYVVKLSDIVQNKCDDDLKEYITSYEDGKINSSQFNTKIDSLDITDNKVKDNLKIYGNDRGYNTFYGMTKDNATCTPGCEDTYERYPNKYAFLDIVISLFNINKSTEQEYGAVAINKGILENNKDNACGVKSCNELLTAINNKYSNKNSDEYHEAIEKLSELFQSKLLLKKEYYTGEDALVDSPSCDTYTIPDDCIAAKEGSCDTGNLIFKTTDNKECIKAGVAYYDNNTSKGYIQTSKNAKYSQIAGVDIVCSEKVEFDLPSNTSAKAGTLLKWGKGENADDFGKMTITQTCYNKDGGNIPSGATYTWDDSVTTEMKLYYKDPSTTGRNYSINGDLSLKSSFVKDEINVSGETLTATAVYKFKYSDDLKWYAKKGTSGEFKKANELSTTEKSSYIEIGYGFPTSFSTRTQTVEDGLKVIIKDIGTKNSTKARFDNYIKILSNGGDTKATSEGYVYSCDYDIYNQLFGYEDGVEPDNDPKGIDVVFRTIDLVDSEDDLSKAFPGRAGDGRNRGRNWNDLSKSFVAQILSSAVYNQEKPQYEIKLNVATIKKIRENNNSMDDPYTNMSEYVCNKTNSPEYGYCASEFLSYLKLGGKLNGTCMEVNITDARAYRGPCGQTWWED